MRSAMLGRIEEQLVRARAPAARCRGAAPRSASDVLPAALERAREGDIAHEHGVARQVVEKRGGGLEEQRQIELDAGWGKALAHAAIDARLRRLALEARAEAAAESLGRLPHPAAFRAPAACARSRAHRASAAYPDRSGGWPRSHRRTDRCAAAAAAPIGKTSRSEPRTANSPGP